MAALTKAKIIIEKDQYLPSRMQSWRFRLEALVNGDEIIGADCMTQSGRRTQ